MQWCTSTSSLPASLPFHKWRFRMAGNVKLLQRWLVLVALARLFSVYLGLWDVNKFKIALIDRQPDLVTPIFGRLFAAWTTVTSILCLTCAYDPTDRPIYIATMASFIVALVFFLSEMFIYETVGVKGGTSPLIIASISAIWMLLGMNYYTRDAVRQPILDEKEL